MSTVIHNILRIALLISLLAAVSACTNLSAAPNMVEYSYTPHKPISAGSDLTIADF